MDAREKDGKTSKNAGDGHGVRGKAGDPRGRRIDGCGGRSKGGNAAGAAREEGEGEG